MDDNLINQRQAALQIIELLAEPLEGEKKVEFIRRAHARYNQEFAVPTKEQMRRFLSK